MTKTICCSRWQRAALLLISAAILCEPWLKAGAADGHWVGTWGCSPQLTEPANLPPAPGLSSNTLRQVVHVSVGGKQLRARFSNTYGTNVVVLDSVHVAASAGGAAIAQATDKALTFRGAHSVMIMPGDLIISDPLDFDVAPLTNLAVTIHFGAASAPLTGHPGSRSTSYLQAGNAVAMENLLSAARTVHWYILSGIDVMTDDSSSAIVVLGDSITDGRGSTTDGNNRWPDCLARRLSTNAPTAGVAVLNMGIGGNAVLGGGLGPPALERFDRDVFGQSSARWLIVLEGVNDIGFSKNTSVTANLIAAYGKFLEKAKPRGIRVYGVPILPFGGSVYGSAAHEAQRQAVNDWIRNSGRFDAVIDLDATVRDPENPARLLPAYDSGDHLHLNPAGYQKMAEAIELKLFAP